MTDTHDELTEYGILTNYPDVTMPDLRYVHGDPVATTSTSVVFADSHGHELNEWANVLYMDRGTLEECMVELAHGITYYDWSVSDPVVFDARTFNDEEDQR